MTTRGPTKCLRRAPADEVAEHRLGDLEIADHPSFNGRIAVIEPGVFPSIS